MNFVFYKQGEIQTAWKQD